MGRKFSTEDITEPSGIKMQQSQSSYFVRITTHTLLKVDEIVRTRDTMC